MINYIKGNIVDSQDRLILHQTNALGVMGAGAAKALAARYDGLAKFYKERYKEGKLTLGSVHYYSDNVIIANLVAQQNYGRVGRYTNYNALRACLENVYEYCVEYRIGEFSATKLGCGLGGGSWGVVEPMINEVFNDSFTINIWEL